MKDNKAVAVVLVLIIVIALAFVIWKATGGGSGVDGGEDYDDSPMDPSKVGVPPEEAPDAGEPVPTG